MSVALVLVVVALHVCCVCIGLVVVSPLVCSRFKFQDLVLSEEDLMPPPHHPTPPSHTTRWRHPLALPLLLLALVGRWYAPSNSFNISIYIYIYIYPYPFWLNFNYQQTLYPIGMGQEQA